MNRRGGAVGIGAAAVISAVALGANQPAQTGTLNGSVVESACGTLPGVTVKIRQLDADLTRSVVTNAMGQFSFPGLPPGDYTLAANLPGFRTATRNSIALRAGEVVPSSLVMEQGPVTIVDRVADPGPASHAPARSSHCVPVETSRGVLLVHATLNDAPEPVWLILDSGASVSVIAEALANARGIPIRTTGETRAGIGEGSSRIGMIGQMAIHIAGTNVVTTNTVALPLGEEFDVIGHVADGVLGSDVFLQYVVRIDYAAASVTLLDAQSFTYQGTGIPIPITLSGNTPDVPVTLEAGSNVLTARAELDTGSDGTIGLTRPFVDKHHLLDGRTTVAGFAMGVGGEATVLVGRIETLRLGPFAFSQPVVAFSRATQGATASTARDGIMGAEVLRRFIVTLDYPHRRVILEPNGRLGDPFDFDMSGLVLAKNSRGTVRVLAVRPETPASQQDVRSGDELVSIDGRAADALPLDTLSRWLRIPDRDYRITLRRAGQPIEIVIRTRRLI